MTQDPIVLENLVELINEHGGIESFSQTMNQLMISVISLTLRIENAPKRGWKLLSGNTPNPLRSWPPGSRPTSRKA